MSIQVIDRLSRLLEVIAQYDRPVSLKILSAESELHTSTTFRILTSLIENGFVEREGEGYRLGTKLIALGHRAAGQVDLKETAEPIMAALCDELNETVNLTQREGDEVIYIGRKIPNRMMRVEQVIGSRAPLHVTAVGKLMLGSAGAAAIRAYAESNGLKRMTNNTITDVEALIAHCTAAVQAGIAFDDEEAEIGVACVGVLLLNEHRQPLAGLSISAPAERRQAFWGEKLLAARDQLAVRMGFASPEAEPQ